MSWMDYNERIKYALILRQTAINYITQELDKGDKYKTITNTNTNIPVSSSSQKKYEDNSLTNDQKSLYCSIGSFIIDHAISHVDFDGFLRNVLLLENLKTRFEFPLNYERMKEFSELAFLNSFFVRGCVIIKRLFKTLFSSSSRKLKLKDNCEFIELEKIVNKLHESVLDNDNGGKVWDKCQKSIRIAKEMMFKKKKNFYLNNMLYLCYPASSVNFEKTIKNDDGYYYSKMKFKNIDEIILPKYYFTEEMYHAAVLSRDVIYHIQKENITKNEIKGRLVHPEHLTADERKIFKDFLSFVDLKIQKDEITKILHQELIDVLIIYINAYNISNPSYKVVFDEYFKRTENFKGPENRTTWFRLYYGYMRYILNILIHSKEYKLYEEFKIMEEKVKNNLEEFRSSKEYPGYFNNFFRI